MDENLSNVQGTNTEIDGAQYIEAIEQIKANSVSKDKYAKLEAENKKLLDSLINGGQIEQPKAKTAADINALRKELFNPDAQLSNLDYAKKALELREALIENRQPDPFLPWGKNISPTAEDVQKANKLAEALQSCVDYADGDSDIFTSELMRITTDAIPTAKNKYRR